MAHELDQKIQDVYKRIETERKFLEASKLIRQATSNPDVLRKNDAKIREAERSLSYFEDTLRELHSRKMMQQRDDHSRSSSTSSSQPGLPQSPRMPRPGEVNRYSGGSSSASGYARNGPRSPELHASGGPPVDDGYGTPKPKTYTNLDLIKADTPHTTAKISRMLHQLEYKLQVEMQYKRGIDKMAKLYQADGDKKSRADAESKRIESERKIQLLQSALKRYKTLHILDDVEEEEEPASGPGPGPAGPGVGGERKDNLRSKPLSGKLLITLKGARELDHAPIVSTFRSRSASKQIETYVSFRIEGTQRARSHPTKTDRWMEDFEITIDKANEVEIAVYDKQASEQHPTLIGLLWIKINDLVEAQRRQKVLIESGQGGWVTAGAMNGDAAGFSGQSTSMSDMNSPIQFNNTPVPVAGAVPGMPGGVSADGIDAWFAVEPAGAVALRLNFIKENVRKRPLDAPGGLGRQGAVRKRKDEVHEMNGHKFIQRQFYQIILCAFCNEFLLNAVGYQCEDCRYTCHKKCYEKVVTKCISKSNTGEDEEKINHRIPHRFEPINNIGANWCCHCGYMLPLGRKNARRCTECGITCHANCAHLVPDFCGMSMETANQLLRDMRAIKEQQRRPTQSRVSPQQAHPALQLSPAESQTPIDQMERMRLGEVPPQQAPGYGHRTGSPVFDTVQPDPRLGGQPVPPPGFPQQPAGRPAPPGRPGVAPPFPSEPQQAYPGHPVSGYEIPPPPDAYQAVPPVPQKQPALPVNPAQSMAPRMTPADRQASLPPVPAVDAQQQQIRQAAARKRKVGLDDFNFLAVLGKGNFGKVMLAEEKKTNSLYAIKVLKKEFIIDNDEVESTRSEKRVFLAAARERHPFLLGLHSCFQTETRVYFVMEYVSGGDLMLHIQRKQFSLRQAKFYASEVLLALEYFHANGIIYRDLKLDNILLTLDGHIKVADYGLCKEEMWFGQTTSTFCGTPEFMAPEILLEQRYGRAVDWWAFGVLMYEMLLGQSPFRGDDEDEIFDAILEDEPLYPITMPRDAVSVLQKLLTRDPTRRLGSGKSDAEEIKRHPFFKDVNFDDVLHKRIPPPYFPTINGSADTSNFDEEFTKEQPTLTPVHTQLSTRDQAEFNGFSWVASWADI
ncbi:Protein kinase C-like [Trametes pubescens]|uniref:protein kinase C n=1 Tax=Trametes pubescens TaxID=154538 RepID=A0A1M2VV97_TRAPU|nr:Protein kinase C-like [Trametes pubescens]